LTSQHGPSIIIALDFCFSGQKRSQDLVVSSRDLRIDSPQKKDHYSILFNIYAKMNDDHVVPNLLSSEPGVKILWQWLAAPDEPQNEANRGVTSLTYNEAMRVVEDIFNLSSGGYEFMTFIHPVLGVEVFEEGDWVRLLHERSRKIRREKSRQITIEVHTIGPGFWVSSSANPELAEAEKSGTKFILYNKDNMWFSRAGQTSAKQTRGRRRQSETQ
jgi:hypothetical protein